MLPGEIQACDRGDEYELDPHSVKLCSSATYTVQVEAFNYMAPVIDVPGADERIRLRWDVGDLIPSMCVDEEVVWCAKEVM